MDSPVQDPRLAAKLRSAEDAAALIHDGMTVAMSGYAMAGYPKGVVEALRQRRTNGESVAIHLVTGANVPWLDEQLSAARLLSRRTPMCASGSLAAQINSGSVRMVEQQMNRMPQLLRSKSFGTIDVAVVEALGFTKNGEMIPTSSVGMTHHLMDAAKALIIEINTAQPETLRGLHDIHVPLPSPKTQPIPLVHTRQRIGTTAIPFDREKVLCILETHIPERMGEPPRGSQEADRITGILLDFLEGEYRHWKGELPPLQLGFGGIANAIARAFQRSSFRDLQFFCGGITEDVMQLLATGKATGLSTGGLGMSEPVEQILRQVPSIGDHLVIRNGDITNNSEVISRLGLVALNTGIEMDIYGNVNSSHITGSRIVNGIGGGANFAQNAGLSVILLPSTARDGAISSIVPMVSHQDIGEHDVDIVITEHGAADLRGLDDHERADAILHHCVSPLYREQMAGYLHRARAACGGHHPQLPEEAFSWYRRLRDTRTMQES